ncbi:MFS transporter [Candidatus Deferrimicrobium sp.]|uniref:MFS transporter n=1 Tax=Candidatus Deferrimicrobium sp. TaxID=3060586 RepID=UPI003C362A5C
MPLIITLAIQSLAAMAAVTVPVFAPVAAADIGVSLASLGIFMAVFYLGGMASSLASGDFVLRYGPIRVSQFCLIACGAGLAATASGSIPLMVPSAMLIGFGYGAVTPASSHILAKTAPPHLMSLTFSIKQTGVPAGGAMAGALVPTLVLFIGWRGAALIVGGVCLLLALVSELSRADLDADRESGRPMSLRWMVEPLNMVLSVPSLREQALASFFFASLQVCLSTYFVSFLAVGLKMPLVHAGLALTVALGAGVLGRIVWGGIADRLVAPRTMLGILGVVMSASAAATYVISLSWPYAAILGVATLFGATAAGWNGVYLAEVARLAPLGKAGTATGGTLFFTYFGGVISPPLFGAVAGTDHRYGLSYLLFSIPIFVFGLTLFRGQRSR